MKAATSFECDGCSHHASFHKMRSKSEETSASRWTRADGSFDREAYELDEEVQEARAKRIRLGHPGDISSNRDITMPSKAKQTLMDSGKKRTRSGAAQGY